GRCGRCAARSGTCGTGRRASRSRASATGTEAEVRAGVIIGVISDTHGLLRPAAVDALRGAAQIIHAGDIGAPEVLASLAAIAPVTAVRGNNDKGGWAGRIPETAVFEAEGVSIYVLHDVNQLALDPAASGFGVV